MKEKTAKPWPEKIQDKLQTVELGHEILCFDSVGSTNDEAKELALQGAQTGTIILAEEQTMGRGRRGRQWLSPKGKGIWMSILLRPQVSPQHAPKFTLLSAVAVAQAIKKITGLPVQIKWPNDILYEGRKVCGILTEMSAKMNSIHYIVVGIGINVNESQKEFHGSIKSTALSLKEAKGEDISRGELVVSILNHLEPLYLEFIEKQDFTRILELWKGMSGILGKEVRAMGHNKVIEGVATDIDEEGALLVKGKDGEIHEIHFGEVSLRGPQGYI